MCTCNEDRVAVCTRKYCDPNEPAPANNPCANVVRIIVDCWILIVNCWVCSVMEVMSLLLMAGNNKNFPFLKTKTFHSNTCTCKNGNLAGCTKKLCPPKSPSPSPTRTPCVTCKSGVESYFDGCNRCTCGADGVEACTRQYCDPSVPPPRDNPCANVVCCSEIIIVDLK